MDGGMVDARSLVWFYPCCCYSYFYSLYIPKKVINIKSLIKTIHLNNTVYAIKTSSSFKFVYPRRNIEIEHHIQETQYLPVRNIDEML